VKIETKKTPTMYSVKEKKITHKKRVSLQKIYIFIPKKHFLPFVFTA